MTIIEQGRPAAARTGDGARPGVLAIDPQTQALLFTQAHTANAFTDEPVTDEQVRAVYDLVKYAPTALNSQPLRVTLVRSDAGRQRLVPHLWPGNRDKTAAAPLVAVLTADRSFHEHLPRLAPHNPAAKDSFADASVREKFARFNGALQLGYFIIGVRAAGLAAGPMTGYDAAGLESELFPDGTRAVIAVVNLGRPGPQAFRPRAARLGYDEVVTTI